LIIITIMLAVTFFYVWHKNKLSGESQSEKLNHGASSEQINRGIRLEGMKYTEIGKDGKQCWKIISKEVEVFLDQKKSLLTDVKAEFYLKNDQHNGTIKLSADKGIFWAGVKDVEVYGNVVVKLPDGTELRTERAIYRNSDKELSSDTPLSISSEWFNGQVGKWKYDLENGKAYGEGGVKVELKAMPREEKKKTGHLRRDRDKNKLYPCGRGCKCHIERSYLG